MNVTTGPAHVLPHASLDVDNWKDILSHPVVLSQGVLSADAVRGTSLFTYPTCPRNLRSDKQKSILCHLAEMFTQWNGTLVFELVFTLPIFVTTKIVFAYLPFPYTSTVYTPAMLAGLQNSVVANPSNQSRVILHVPFVATTNWLGTAEPSGEICAVLLEPLVFSMDYRGGLPWTLFVYADARDFNFRYILPPLVEQQSSVGQTNTVTFVDQFYAASASSSGYLTDVPARANNRSLMIPSTTSTVRSLQSMMMIPRSRVEFVMQKVRGQFPTGVYGADVVSSMFDAPVSSLSTYVPEGLDPYAVYPYITYPFAAPVVIQANVSSSVTVPSGYHIFSVVYIVNQDGVLQGVCLRVTREQYDANLVPLQTQAWLSPAIWRGGAGFGNARFKLVRKVAVSGVYFHVWFNDQYLNGPRLDEGTAIHECMAMAWVRLSQSARVCEYLRQIDSAPAEVTHLALYTTMPPEQAATFANWLTTQDNTAPPTFILGHSIVFSTTQAPLAFNDSRMATLDSRGIVWRLFKLFKGDETKWYAWLVKALDIIVDALIGAFVGRSDTSQVVPIGRGSPMRLEPVGAYSAAAITSYTERVLLEPILRESGVSLISALEVLETPVVEMPRLGLFRRRRSKGSSVSSSASRAVASDAPQRVVKLTPRSPAHRARFPSSRKARLRKFLRG